MSILKNRNKLNINLTAMFEKNYNRKDIQLMAKCFFSKSTGEVKYESFAKYYDNSVKSDK